METTVQGEELWISIKGLLPTPCIEDVECRLVMEEKRRMQGEEEVIPGTRSLTVQGKMGSGTQQREGISGQTVSVEGRRGRLTEVMWEEDSRASFC